ncbi:hypothetical protein M758_3G165000 [Ceratodon purpureus]|nr:hypothetical protein M758_3G165000 [Ceratodon purpureus]
MRSNEVSRAEGEGGWGLKGGLGSGGGAQGLGREWSQIAAPDKPARAAGTGPTHSPPLPGSPLPVPAFITPPRCACPRLLPAPLQPRALVSHSSPVATHHGEPCSALALPCTAHAHAPARATEGGRDSVSARLRVGGDRRREWRGREIRTRRRTEGRGGGEWGRGFGSERERGEEG